MSSAQKFEEIIKFHLEKVNSVKPTQSYYDLQNWQAKRLMATHDSLYQEARFRPAMEFFTNDLYCSKTFIDRNRQLLRALPMMSRVLPDSVLFIVAEAAELHSLTLEMDALLIHHLPTQTEISLLTLPEWVNAYQQSNNQQDRNRQIELIESLGQSLKGIVKKPMIRALLNWATVPAKVAGFEEIHSFICKGFYAFSELENPDDFLIPVVEKERELSSRWRQGDICQ